MSAGNMGDLLSDIDPVEFVPVASVHDGGVPQACMAMHTMCVSSCMLHTYLQCAYTVWNVMLYALSL